MTPHQYIERETHKIVDERLYGDKVIRFIYSRLREDAPLLFRLVTGRRVTGLLGFVNYDRFLSNKLSGNGRFLRRCGVDVSECLDDPAILDTPKKIFERKIRYWETRPMSDDPSAIVSPADARVLLGSFCETDMLCVKEKFFEYEQLLGSDKTKWIDAFQGGDFAVFRLTPDKYHYNHMAVSGKVVDFYSISGRYHSCNPQAVITAVTPYSMNKRVVTIIDTDVEGGSQAGLVAFIEVVAIMIGDIVQCYSGERYDDPSPVAVGMFLKKGLPKSLYRPGSSTDILIFQQGRVAFADDLLKNLVNSKAQSRYTEGFGAHLVETDIKVRSTVATVCK